MADLRRENAVLRKEAEDASAAEELAQERCAAAEEDVERQRQSSQSLLNKLLAEQRKRFEDETVSIKRQLTEKNAREARQERLEMLRRMIGRRMMNQDLHRGYTAWLQMWEAKVYAMNRLRQVASRLKSPEVSNATQLAS